MILRRASYVLLPAVLVLAPLAWSARRMATAQSTLESSRSQLQSTTALAERVVRLRARRQQVAEHKRPEQDAIARVTSSLTRAGIPIDRLAGLRPESDAALSTDSGERTYRRQTIRFSLTRLSVAELGEFLAHWRHSNALWTPTQIELLHTREKDASGRYDVSILIATTYLADK